MKNNNVFQSGLSVTASSLKPAWITIVLGFLCPPLMLLLIKRRSYALISLAIIVASLIIAQIYTSINSWPFPIWAFPLQFAVNLVSAFYLYQLTLENNEPINHARIGVISLVVLFGILCIYIYSANFILSRYAIASVSMNPTLTHGDFVITSKSNSKNASWLAKLLNNETLAYGDLVIFKHPTEDEIYVKRIIALPGDELTFNGNALLINGKHVKRELIMSNHNNSPFRWLKNELYYEYNHGKMYQISLTGESAQVSGEITVPPGHLFVMGDNRNQSMDSRFWGLLPENNILERPLLIWWSVEPSVKPRIRWERIGNWIN